MKITTALIADAAVVQAGKLYVHGGGWDVIHSSTFPATHPTMALALIARVEYDEALDDIHMNIDLLDEDDNPLLPTVEATIRTGHAPGSGRGHPSFVPQALTLNMLRFEKAGGYRFRVLHGESELSSIPFRLATL